MRALTGLTILFFVVTQSFSAHAQNHKGLCKVEVDDVTSPIVLKYLNCSVTFKNYASKTVDGITWIAYYYNADELIKKRRIFF